MENGLFWKSGLGRRVCIIPDPKRACLQSKLRERRDAPKIEKEKVMQNEVIESQHIGLKRIDR